MEAKKKKSKRGVGGSPEGARTSATKKPSTMVAVAATGARSLVNGEQRTQRISAADGERQAAIEQVLQRVREMREPELVELRELFSVFRAGAAYLAEGEIFTLRKCSDVEACDTGSAARLCGIWDYIRGNKPTLREAIEAHANGSRWETSFRSWQYVAPEAGASLLHLQDMDLVHMMRLHREWACAEFVVAPLGNAGGTAMTHWALLVYRREESMWCLYDSLPSERMLKSARDLQRVMRVIMADDGPAPTLHRVNGIFEQVDGYSCGPAVCAWAKAISKAVDPVSVNQKTVNDVRRELVELLEVHRGRIGDMNIVELTDVQGLRSDPTAWVGMREMTFFMEWLWRETALEVVPQSARKRRKERDNNDNVGAVATAAVPAPVDGVRRSNRLMELRSGGAAENVPSEGQVAARTWALRQLAAVAAHSEWFPIPFEDLSPDFAWRPSVPGCSGCVVFSLDRRLFHSVSRPCVGCGEIHPVDWSHVTVLDRVWRFHCNPTLTAAVTGWAPFVAMEVKGMAFVMPGEHDYVQKSGLVEEAVGLKGFDCVPRGFYRWRDALEEDDDDEEVEANISILVKKCKTFYQTRASEEACVAGEFVLDPLCWADEHLVLQVAGRNEMMRTQEDWGVVIVPRSLFRGAKLVLEYVSRQLKGQRSLLWLVCTKLAATVWSTYRNELEKRARSLPRVQVSSVVGWVVPGALFVLGNDLQVAHKSMFDEETGPDWHERLGRTHGFNENGDWMVATARETGYWVVADRTKEAPLHPSFRGPAYWSYPVVDEDALLGHVMAMHKYVRKSWKTNECPNGQNYPCFLLTQSYGGMCVQRDRITEGGRHFPFLLACGERRRGKSTSSKTLVSMFAPYVGGEAPCMRDGRDVRGDLPSILGADASTAHVRKMLEWLKRVPLVLDDTDNIRRDDLATLLQEYATGAYNVSGGRNEGCLVTNVNPDKDPNLPRSAARRAFRLQYVGDDVRVPSKFDVEMARCLGPMFLLLPIVASIPYRADSVALLLQSRCWKELLWPAIERLYPDADETDHAVWLYFTIEYGSLLMGKDAMWSVEQFGLAFGARLRFKKPRDGEDPFAFVCRARKTSAEAVPWASKLRQYGVQVPSQAAAVPARGGDDLREEAIRLIKLRFFDADGTLKDYDSRMYGDKLVIQKKSEAGGSMFDVHPQALFEVLSGLAERSATWRATVEFKSDLVTVLKLGKTRSTKVERASGSRTRNVKMAQLEILF